MIHIRITQDWTVRCDHCGEFSGIYKDTTYEAIEAAVKQGFILTRWVYENCPRELLLCASCHEEALKKGRIE